MSRIEVTKFGHACVRLAKNGRSVVVDPGELTREVDAINGADAVLVTHEHPDHVDVGRIRRALSNDSRLAVHTCPGVARLFSDFSMQVHILPEKQTREIAGFKVTAVGSKHHYSHPDSDPVDNVGFLFDDEVLYTGDSLPHLRTPTLLVTGDAPWLTIPDLLEYLRIIQPGRTLIVHDGLLNDDGLAVLDDFLRREANRSGREVRRLRLGERVQLTS